MKLNFFLKDVESFPLLFWLQVVWRMEDYWKEQADGHRHISSDLCNSLVLNLRFVKLQIN